MSGHSRFARWFLPGFVFQSVIIGGGYATGRELVELIERLRPRNRSAEAFAAATRAATTDEHEQAFRELADLGVARASVALTANDGPDRVAAFGDVIKRFT